MATKNKNPINSLSNDKTDLINGDKIEYSHKLRVVELFSGIGSQAKALKNINVQFEVVATCEWSVRAMIAYALIHTKDEFLKGVAECNLSKDQLLESLKDYNFSMDSKSKMSFKSLNQSNIDVLKCIYSSLQCTKNKVDIQNLSGYELPTDIDIMTYSFPCQDLSLAGNMHRVAQGISKSANTRSGLVWQVERILHQLDFSTNTLPKVLVLENVVALQSRIHKDDFEEWKNVLKNLGYHNKIYVLNSDWFGAVQKRKRLIMLSFLVGDDVEKCKQIEDYFLKNNLEYEKYRQSQEFNSNIKSQDIKEILKLDYSNKIYFEEAMQCQPKDTTSRLKIWEENTKIVDINDNSDNSIKDIQYKYSSNIATITTKQDRNPNAGCIYFDYKDNIKSKFRYLTARECFLLMGFDESDYQNIIENNINIRKNVQLFSQISLHFLAGNSIVVEILEQVFRQVVELYKIIF